MSSNVNIDIKNLLKGEKLGSGAFAKVYKIKNKETNEIYAGKQLNFSIDQIEKENALSLSNEINIMAKLDHPSILRYIGFSPYNFKNENKPIIFTEFASKDTLASLIDLERHSMALSEYDDLKKLIIIYKIASGMSYLHQHNIIHRDLKPENILMDEKLSPKIADFGLSKIDSKSGLQSTNGCKGTPIYMAPEVFETHKSDKRSDVYAFSLIVYQIVTCEIPFKNITQINELFTYVIKQNFRPKISASVSDSYRNLIEKCWAVDPTDRPTFEEIVKMLKEDEGFLMNPDDKDDFYDEIESFDETKTSFYKKRRILKLNRTINENDDSKIFQIVPIIKRIKNASSSSSSSSDDDDESEQGKIDEDTVGLISFIKGKNYFEGINGYEKNIELGLKYIKKSCKKGCAKAIIYYSGILIDGNHVNRNIPKAKRYILNILNSNDPTVYELYSKIQKKEGNLSESQEFLIKAAEAGSPKSQFKYGKKLYRDAIKYLELAEKNGFEKSYEFLTLNSKSYGENNIDMELFDLLNKKLNQKAGWTSFFLLLYCFVIIIVCLFKFGKSCIELTFNGVKNAFRSIKGSNYSKDTDSNMNDNADSNPSNDINDNNTVNDITSNVNNIDNIIDINTNDNENEKSESNTNEDKDENDISVDAGTDNNEDNGENENIDNDENKDENENIDNDESKDENENIDNNESKDENENIDNGESKDENENIDNNESKDENENIDNNESKDENENIDNNESKDENENIDNDESKDENENIDNNENKDENIDNNDEGKDESADNNEKVDVDSKPIEKVIEEPISHKDEEQTPITNSSTANETPSNESSTSTTTTTPEAANAETSTNSTSSTETSNTESSQSATSPTTTFDPAYYHRYYHYYETEYRYEASYFGELQRQLTLHPQIEGRQRAILISTGAYCPIHEGHLKLFDTASQFLSTNYNIDSILGIISPSSDEYVFGRFRNEAFPIKQRFEAARLACNEHNQLDKSSITIVPDLWEGSHISFIDFPYVYEHFAYEINSMLPSENLLVLYVCGADLYVKTGCNLRNGYVGIARPGLKIENQTNLQINNFVCNDKKYTSFYTDATMAISLARAKGESIKGLTYDSVEKYLHEVIHWI